MLSILQYTVFHLLLDTLEDTERVLKSGLKVGVQREQWRKQMRDREREKKGENRSRRRDLKDSLPGQAVVGRSLAAGYTRLSAGINLGWIRLEGLSLTLEASWPLEAPLSLHISPQDTDTPSNWAEKCQDGRTQERALL